MREHGEEIQRLAEESADCRKILQALGDANRQHLILEMLRMGRCGGVRVGDRIVENVAGTGANVVATRRVAEKKR